MGREAFVFSNTSNDEIPPDAFGYWSVRWSDKHAQQSLDGIKNDRAGCCSTYMQSFFTYLQLVSVYTASYWVYAIYMTDASTEVMDRMKKGTSDSIKEFSDPNGNQFTNELTDVFDRFFKRYFTAIINDIKEANITDANVYNPDINNLAKSFVELVEYYNFKDGEKMSEIDRMYIGNFVADIPNSIFEALKEQGLVFEA